MLIYFSRYFNSLASKVYLYVRWYVNLLVCIVTCRWDFISHAKSMAPKNSPSNNNNYEKTGWSRCNFYLFVFPQKQDRLTLSAWSLFFRAVCNNIPQLILNTSQRLISTIPASSRDILTRWVRQKMQVLTTSSNTREHQNKQRVRFPLHKNTSWLFFAQILWLGKATELQPK